MATAYIELEQRDSAASAMDRALQLPSDSTPLEDRANAFCRRGMLYRSAGQDARALRAFDNALQELLGDALRDSTKIARYVSTRQRSRSTALQVWSNTLARMGALHREAGRADTAFALLRRSHVVGAALVNARLSMGTRSTVSDHEIACLAPVNRTACSTDSPSVVDRLQHARHLATWLGDVLAEAMTLQDLSSAYRTLGRADSATSYQTELALLRRRAGMRSDLRPLLPATAVPPAGFNEAWGEFAYVAPHRVDTVRVRRALAQSLASRGRWSEARLVLHATRALLDSVSLLDSDWSEVAVRSLRGGILRDIARTFARARTARLDSAAHYYDRASAELLTQLTSDSDDESRVNAANAAAEVHAEWSLTWIRRRTGAADVERTLAALAALDRGRMQGLRLLRGNGGDDETVGDIFGAPMWGRVEYRPLGARLTEDFTIELDEPTGSPHAFLAYMMTGDTVVVWGALGDASSLRAEVMTVRRREVRALVDTVRGYLDQRARSLYGSVDAAPYHRAVRRLSDVLLPSSLLRALRIPPSADFVIVPYEELSRIPFAVLQLPRDTVPFGIRHALRYVPSVATLREENDSALVRPLSPREKYRRGAGLLDPTLSLFRESQPDASAFRASLQRWQRAALVTGDVRLPTRTAWGERVSLPPLPFAPGEARDVAGRLEIVPLSKDQSTELEVRRRIANASVVHLATHGVAYGGANVRRSWIALGSGGGHDGFLTVEEILAPAFPRLRADLIVLSACQTASGSSTAAEGTIGFQRAFFAKGARSLVASLWDSLDPATAMLMHQFYQAWLDPTRSISKAEALRLAQAEVRKTVYADPAFWANMQLIGAP
jgi:tetratricopeptide (TPR) repeat protein